MEEKPGIKTTEFWLALLAQLIPLLVIFGVIAPEEADNLQEAATQLVMAVGAFIAAVLPIWKYIDSRTRVKEAATMKEVAAMSDSVVINEFTQ